MTSISQIEVFSKEKFQEKSINTHYNEIGVDNEAIKNIENILLANGIEQKNLELVKRYIIIIMKEIPVDKRKFELSDKNKDYLREISVKSSQIEIIKRIALRISLNQNR
jgi:hypothetical protein